MRRLMDWTLEDNMVDGLFFCATFTSCRGGHAPYVQTGAETPDTGAEAVKPDPGSSCEGHSVGICAGAGDENARLVGLSAYSASHWWSAQCTERMLSDVLMSYCVAGINGCLDLRCHAFVLNGQVNTEWSRCWGSMACQRQCGSIATKLSRLDACEGWKVVCWCRTQASSHNSQGVVNGGV